MAVAGDTSYLASGLLEQIIAEAIIQLGDAGVTSKLVRQEYRPKGDQVSFQVYNAGTHQITSGDVGSVTDGSEISAAYLGSEKKTITLALYGVRTDVYDDTNYSSAQDPAQYIGTILGNAVAAKWDSLLNALFAGFSNSVGTSTAALTVDNMFAAYSKIKTNKGRGQMFAVLDPRQIWGDYGLSNDIVTSSQFGGSPELQSIGLRDAWFQKVAGIEVFSSPEITEASNAVKGGVFVREALALAYAGPNSGIKVETQREAQYLRDMFVASTFCGVAELVDGWGVAIHTKVS